MRDHAVLGVIVLALAACSVEGVSIEIRQGSTDAERVELYIMDGVCTTDSNGEFPCTQLKTPSASTYLEGQIYTRDDARTLSAAMESGVAYFTIRANGDETRIPLLVAVGFDANNTRVGAVMIDREFFTTDNNRQIATLDRIVEDRVTGRPMSDGLRVETWYDEPNACVALEKTKEGTSHRTFIVPAEDFDCDGWAADQECDSMWPDHGPDDDSTLPFTCVVEDTSNGAGKRCLLGDAPCVDGLGSPRCDAIPGDNDALWCVPSALCDPICKDSTNPLCPYAALKAQPTTVRPTFVDCAIPVYQTSSGHFRVCQDNIEATLITSSSIRLVDDCSGFAIGPVTATGIGPFATIRTSTTAQVHIVRADFTQICDLSLRFGGDFPATTLFANAYPDLVVKLDLLGRPSLVMPLLVKLVQTDEGSCANSQATCTTVTSDGDIDESLAACATP